MRTLLISAGVIVCALSLFQFSSFVSDYSMLTEYGQGHVWGSVLLFIVGLVVIYFGLRAKGASTSK